MGAVVAAVGALVPAATWFVADVEATGASGFRDASAKPREVGSTEMLLQQVAGVDQFLRGVLVAIPPSTPAVFRSAELWTEDDESADLGSAVAEIRAFDTSYIDVATVMESILSAVSTRFSAVLRGDDPC